MGKRKFNAISIGFAVLILLTVALLGANSLRRSSRIVLPAPAGSSSAGTEEPDSSQGTVRIEVRPDTVQAAIATLSRMGILSGYEDGSFRPNATVTRAEFAAMAVRFFDVEYDGPDLFSDTTGHWASDLINKAASAGIILGFKDGTFRPDQDITRAEAIAIFNRVLGRAPDKDHLLPDMITWPDNMDTDAWYYANMQEATNSHDYDRVKAADGTEYEVWTKILPVRDWAAFETEWATAGSAKNPGDVYSSQP